MNDYIALGPFYHLRECKPIELPPELATQGVVIHDGAGHLVIHARSMVAARAAEADRETWLFIVKDSDGKAREHMFGDSYKVLTAEAKA